jgi:hypothetical protein
MRYRTLGRTVRPDTTFPDGDFRNEYFAGDRKRETYERVQAITAELGVPEDSAASVAPRFCLSEPAVSTVIAGMRTSCAPTTGTAATKPHRRPVGPHRGSASASRRQSSRGSVSAAPMTWSATWSAPAA